MKSRYLSLTRATAVLGIAALFVFLTGPVLSAPNSDSAATSQCRQERIQGRLERMAERLKIAPAQQSAWTAYTETVAGLIGSKAPRPAADADATSVARFRAERAAEQAQKLARLADATAALEQMLSVEQRQTLKEMMHHAGRHRHSFREKA